MTKYCTNASYSYNGFVDNLANLEMEDDAAHKKLGGGWRMPTKEEMKELYDNCLWEEATLNGVSGRKVTGPNGNSIFLPAAGRWGNKYIYSPGSEGSYWTSSLWENQFPYAASQLSFWSETLSYYWYEGRTYGKSIRAVYAE